MAALRGYRLAGLPALVGPPHLAGRVTYLGIAGTGQVPASALFTFNGQLIFAGARYQANLTPVGTPTADTFTVSANSVTVKRAGRYKVRAHLLGGYQFELELRKNGGLVFAVCSANADDGLAFAVVPRSGTSEIQLAANDVLAVWMRSLTGAFGGSESSFEVTFVPTPDFRK